MDTSTASASAPVLDIRGLTTSFATAEGVAQAVDTASLTLEQGETLALVGESGCGKSVLALSVLGLVPDPPGRVTAGQALFDGRDLLALPERELQDIRGRRIAMIFQEPMTSLNPVLRIGEQIAETHRRHFGSSRAEAAGLAVDMLARVGIPGPADTARSYPHQLSGGMRQRVMIAMALVCGPEVLVADEPTTALDVTIQAQILDLLLELRGQSGSSGLLITHDLGVVARMCRRAAVMYAGRIVEQGPVREIFRAPLHPYTRGLLGSLPVPGRRGGLSPIPGIVPSIYHLPTGCRFHPRCPEAMDICREREPEHLDLGGGRRARCWLHAPR
ncbi:MAG: ABC transporter ATP-binding protein [Desulfovibrionaceae bacterium]